MFYTERILTPQTGVRMGQSTKECARTHSIENTFYREHILYRTHSIHRHRRANGICKNHTTRLSNARKDSPYSAALSCTSRCESLHDQASRGSGHEHSIQNTFYTEHILYRIHSIQYTFYTEHIVYSTHSIQNTFYTVYILQRTHSIQYTFYTEHILYSIHSIQNTFYRGGHGQCRRGERTRARTHTHTHTHTHAHTHTCLWEHQPNLLDLSPPRRRVTAQTHTDYLEVLERCRPFVPHQCRLDGW
jgi:hypothetical protein